MVQVISNLGNTSKSFSAMTIVRPVAVSIAFGCVVPIACRFVVWPSTQWINGLRSKFPNLSVWTLLRKKESSFLIHTAILISMVAGATYAGTSNLFAAYLVGAAVSWWDSKVLAHDPHGPPGSEKERPSNAVRTGGQSPVGCAVSKTSPTYSTATEQNQGRTEEQGRNANAPNIHPVADSTINVKQAQNSGIVAFRNYYHQPLHRLLQPFFFASLGFSIPVRRMFAGNVIWRGIVYTLLMSLGKVACGLWLVRIQSLSWLGCWWPKVSKAKRVEPASASVAGNARNETHPMATAVSSIGPQQDKPSSAGTSPSHQSPNPRKPLSLYPAMILGSAMVARGEIGFLISSLAEANGVFGEKANEVLFLVVTWAIVLCTIIGPLGLGAALRTIRTVDTRKEDGRDILGVWGVT
jgi:hypothetical protein